MLDEDYVSGGQLERDVLYVEIHEGTDKDWRWNGEESVLETIADDTFVEAAKRLAKYVKSLQLAKH